MEDEDTAIGISSIQLCQYLAAAERKGRRAQSLIKHSFAHEVKKRKRSETPPEEITSGDEARYVIFLVRTLPLQGAREELDIKLHISFIAICVRVRYGE